MSGPGGRMMMGGGPDQRSMNFKESGKRLVRQLAPEKATLWVMLLAVVCSVGLSVVGPKILGKATDLVFAGVVGRQIPTGVTKAQAIDGLRHKGQGGLADMLSGVDFTPGQGIDFGGVGSVLLAALAVYVCAGLLMLVATRLSNRAINKTVFRMREDIQTKLSRLPLSYFDKAKRGEVLSRATNDIDNISQTMQQTMGQLINSLLTIVGVLVMMFWISPLLALVALVTVPLSVVVATKVGKRSQPQFVQQWKSTGKLNAHIEEMYTGHALVKVFGRQQESANAFAEQNDALYEASFKAQFNSGVMQPLMMFVSNLNYVLVAVVGGLRVATGTLSIGDVQAFIQYSRQFSMPLTQVASMANLVQSGVASAERIFELLDAEEQAPDASLARAPRGAARRGRAGERVVPLRAGEAAHRGPLADGGARSHGRDRRPDGRRQDDAGEPAHAVLRGHRRPDHPGRGGRREDDPRGAALRDRHGAPGHLAVRRLDRGQHRVRRRATGSVHAARRSRRRRGRPTRTVSSARSPRATTPSSTTRAPGSARARSSSSPSRGRSCPTR